MRDRPLTENSSERTDAWGGCTCGTGAAMGEGMKSLFPADGMRRHFVQIALFVSGLLLTTGCSKSDVTVSAQPSPQPLVFAQNDRRQSAADRVVEIDRLLAVPLTGRPEESDRRAALRAEREALVASGQVPYQLASQGRNRNVPTPPNNTVTRTSNGNVVHYAAPTTRTQPITVAPLPQSSNLSFLEQMTPTEREHYYKTIRLQNTQRVEVDVRRH